MATLLHGPENCAAVHPEIGAMARSGFGRMDAVATRHGVSVQGAWSNPTGHVFYVLADAPSAHAINAVMVELQLFHWNTVEIHPIVTVEEALSLSAHESGESQTERRQRDRLPFQT
jgi:muconolactone delta-isomerase